MILAVQDIFLDTPLVNAHTSATDILWAGGEVNLVVFTIVCKCRMLVHFAPVPKCTNMVD
jgi:hypothetical protein